MTDTCKEHSYFIETRSPDLVGQITEVTDDKVVYKIYKGKELVRRDSNTKKNFFRAIEDGRLRWIETPLGG